MKRQSDRETERHRETQRETETQRHRETERQRDRAAEKQRKIERGAERDTQTERYREIYRKKEKTKRTKLQHRNLCICNIKNMHAMLIHVCFFFCLSINIFMDVSVFDIFSLCYLYVSYILLCMYIY